MLQVLLIFMEIKSSASIIFVPNLKEMETWDDGLINFKFCAKMKNMQKLGDL